MLQQFTMITAVWGGHHTSLFLNFGLPSLLAEESLPKFCQHANVEYVIYTRPDQEQRITSDPSFKLLQQITKVSLIIFTEQYVDNHWTMAACHKMGLEYATAKTSYAVFIPPDCIWDQKAMFTMYKLVERGYKIVHMSGIRVISELFCAQIQKNENHVINISSRNLVNIALRYLHPITNSHFFAEKKGALMPANLLWSVGEHAILAKNFHLHPLVIDTTYKQFDFRSTIDDDLALGFDADNSEEYVITDSDELIAFEMSRFSHTVMSSYEKGNIEDIAKWAVTGTNAKHRVFVKKSILIHGDGMDYAELEKVESAANSVIEQILFLLNTSEPETLNITKLIYLKTRGFMTFILRKLILSTDFIMRSPSKGFYPWHWRFCFKYDVMQHMVNSLLEEQGRVLYFDDKYHSFAQDLLISLANKKDIEIDFRNINKMLDDIDLSCEIYKEYYDLIIFRDSEAPISNPDVFVLLKAIMKPDAKVICYAATQKVLTKLNSSISNDIKCVSEQGYGHLGTKILSNSYRWYRKNLGKKWMAFLRYSIVANSFRVLLLPFIIIVNPLLSIFAFCINSIASGDKHWVERKLVYVKDVR